MIPYKDIGDNLTVNEFNGVISLLRDNINFEENLTINNSTVKGQYAEYVFDFQEATILDNGILITNETLSNIGTVKLTKAVFPHSNYFIDLKVYSSTDVGISDMDHTDYIVTELSIPLRHNAEVNIPFETLEMDNIISFDAKIRINHKDLIIRGTDRLSLTAVRNPLLNYVPSNFEAVYVDADGYPVADKQVNFYKGETLLGTDTTDGSGIATLNIPFSSIGSHTVQATSESLFSNNSSVTVVDDGDFSFIVTGDNFETYSSTPFDFSEDELQIEFGDNDGIAYTNGKITHNYSSSGNYTITILGEITKLNENCFKNSTLSTISIPNSVTTIGNSCFSECSELTSVTLPNTLTELNSALFNRCTSLNSISIPANVTSIGDGCFYSCTGLTSITFPNNLLSIGRDSFVRCTGLTSITFPNTLTNIGIGSFSECTGLTTINIPTNVTSMGTNAFAYCTNLQEIVLNWDNSSEIVSYDNTWIRNCSSFTHFLIPVGTTSLYVAKGYPSSKLVEDVSYTDLVVSADKQILSYADNDKATLYAQLIDGQGQSVAISNVEITFKVGSTTLGSAYTDNTGKATLTNGYTSTGAGDVQITVTDGSFVTETYGVQDLLKYDSGATDNTSKYTTSNNASISYDNNGYYLLKKNVNNNFGKITVNNLSVPSDFKVSADIELLSTSTTNLQPAIQIGNLIGRIIHVNKQISLCNQSYSDISTNTYSNIALNTWYTLELIVENGTATLNLKNGDTVLVTCTGNVSSLIGQSNTASLLIGYNTNSSVNAKNIKIKPL